MAKGGLNSLLNKVGKLNPHAGTLKESDIAKIPYFISTGNYALDAKISAKLMGGGIGGGRITTLFGPSQSGKSLVSSHIQKNAQKMGITPIIFDSEFDKDGRMEESIGVDTSKVGTVPVDTIEQATIQMYKMFDEIIVNEEYGKYVFILDSLASLATEKLLDDASKKNKVAQDMGLKAKLVRSFYNAMKAKCALSKCALVVINHESADPNQMYESIFKKQGGGKAIEFFSTTMIHISAKKEKSTGEEGDEVLSDAKGGYSGQLIRFFMQKNRLAIPHLECETYLNFITGWDKYSGLKDIAINLGVIEPDGRSYNLIHEDGTKEKIGFFKTWKKDKEFWEKKIFPILEKKVSKEYVYRAIDLSE